MKLLVVGIDGGDESIFDTMPMPFIHAQKEQSRVIHLKEDLWSRGWSKILCGMDGAKSGALYTKPTLEDGVVRTTQSYKTSDYDKNNAAPLWEAINQRGMSVGFMNVPTTNPAPKVNGFFVSGAGGGLGNALTIPDGACYPSGISKHLLDVGYVFDTRLVGSGIVDFDVFCDRMIAMMEARVEAYLLLNDQFDVDFGFVAFMGVQRLQYLAMSEIEKLKSQNGSPASDFQEKLVSVYRALDLQLEKLLNGIKADGVVFVSDHGQAKYEHSIEIGRFLIDQGFMNIKSENKTRLVSRLRKGLAGILPVGIKSYLKSNSGLAKKALNSSIIDFSTSQAFGVRYVSGVYVNDSRFGKAVEPGDVVSVAENIVEAFNSTAEARAYGMSARLFRSKMKDIVNDQFVPDVWIDVPDTMFFEYGLGKERGRVGNFVQKNENCEQPIELSRVTGDMWTGIKGKSPIYFLNHPRGNTLSGSANDLTSVYHDILELLFPQDEKTKLS